MITDALLWVLSGFVSLVGSLFPTANLSGWPTEGTPIGEWIGEMAGPADSVMPISEIVLFVDFLLLVWLPAVVLYEAVTWAYRHIPLIGAGK